MLNKTTYIPPTVTVDGVILQIIDGKLNVLLIKRTREPFKGEWALPGGYSNAGETTKEALARILSQKTGVALAHVDLVDQLHIFDSIARDPRGHAVSIVYVGIGRDIIAMPNTETQNPQFFPLSELPALAYDHDEIIYTAHAWLRSKMEQTNIAFTLLPPHFTLTELQGVYEAVLGKKLDKRNFRKRFLSFGFVEETGEVVKDGAHRPAMLYKFRKNQLEAINRHL